MDHPCLPGAGLKSVCLKCQTPRASLSKAFERQSAIMKVSSGKRSGERPAKCFRNCGCFVSGVGFKFKRKPGGKSGIFEVPAC